MQRYPLNHRTRQRAHRDIDAAPAGLQMRQPSHPRAWHCIAVLASVPAIGS
ncbi:hypothetical protein [Achromobacter xylosoxidans]|uniref:hypothetical protein n=1 Tax=Alcaligenes xylosoxydans xylosoxydans TaxID=85698 RepID=UPI001F109728|nr:hypothetical protein [Achromobacter xylosoxidans]MCH4576184.1 hypothetical protein [Achromobacter xylosoxidans]